MWLVEFEQVLARHEGHVVAKCYYAKKKIVWEILQGALKRKIEIHWADIIGINAVIKDNECGILLIEVNLTIFLKFILNFGFNLLWKKSNNLAICTTVARQSTCILQGIWSYAAEAYCLATSVRFYWWSSSLAQVNFYVSICTQTCVFVLNLLFTFCGRLVFLLFYVSLLISSGLSNASFLLFLSSYPLSNQIRADFSY